jgi:hypothetical protein
MQPANEKGRPSGEVPAHASANAGNPSQTAADRNARWPQGWDACTCCSVWFANPNGEPECIDCRSANRSRSGRVHADLVVAAVLVLVSIALPFLAVLGVWR